MTLRTKYCARSTNFPVNSPVTGSSSMAPPPGGAVSLVTCASANAWLLAMVTWAPKPIDTGWFGAASSSSSRRGKRFSGMRKSCIGLPVPTIQVPGGTSRVCARTTSRTCGIERTLVPKSRTSILLSEAAPSSARWTCGSVRPGMTVRPWRSITSVRDPRRSSISLLPPTARIRPILTATASNARFSASAVSTRPLARIRSGARVGCICGWRFRRRWRSLQGGRRSYARAKRVRNISALRPNGAPRSRLLQHRDIGGADAVVGTGFEVDALRHAVHVLIAPQKTRRRGIEDGVERLVQYVLARLRIERDALLPQPSIDVGIRYADPGRTAGFEILRQSRTGLDDRCAAPVVQRHGAGVQVGQTSQNQPRMHGRPDADGAQHRNHGGSDGPVEQVAPRRGIEIHVDAVWKTGLLQQRLGFLGIERITVRGIWLIAVLTGADDAVEAHRLVAQNAFDDCVPIDRIAHRLADQLVVPRRMLRRHPEKHEFSGGD